MTLLEALEQVEKLNSDATIWIDCSQEWSADSFVAIAEERVEGGAPDDVPSTYEYFLEVFLVSELIHDLNLESCEQVIEYIISYAENDA
ncbi:hypothetical protein [Pseudoalteromonas sp. OOF1S-7]|uniref:hypothetical protein n=1 Tax=Pseudoalteromonas sp. OOF1S-7 TaxID=2917757 RepID=UPI001EF5FE02|nr:hypothetical protein [Pseudoalteromonas sp. OOF1S-7]MCG7533376.1 hypothetical protein [Pseudoalteromonas sp. OOF1S-7]